MKKISLIIPSWNEKDGIEGTIKAVPRDELAAMEYETQVLVIDGGSLDGTAEMARRAGAEVITELKRGYGRAYKTGFAHASGDIIVTADADSTYPMDDIPRLVRLLEEEGLDFITTNRFAQMENGAMSFRNKVGNKILSLTMRLLFRLDIKDSQSGMWVFKRSILDKLILTSNTPLSQELKIEACYFARCHWKEVPIRYKSRSGKVKLGGWKVGFVNFCDLFRKRLTR